MIENCGGLLPLAYAGLSKERNRIMFEDVPFSHSSSKHSIISFLFLWAGIMPNVNISFVKRVWNLYMSTARS